MTAVWQSVSALSDQLGADLTVTKPSGTVDGDLLIAIGRCSGAASITKPDSSWDDSFSLSVAAPFFWKKAASEGSNYTFVVSGAVTTSEVSIVRISGQHASSPIDAVSGVTGAGALVIPALTSAGANRLLMQMVVKLGTGNTWSGPGSQTERYDTTSSNVNFTYAGGDEVVGSGSTGTRTWTPSSGTATSVGYMVAIAPIPPNTGTFSGAYDFAGSGFTGQAGPGQGTFAGGYDFAGSGWTGEAPGVASGTFTGSYDFSSTGFAGEGGDADFLIDIQATEGGRRRWGGRK